MNDFQVDSPSPREITRISSQLFFFIKSSSCSETIPLTVRIFTVTLPDDEFTFIDDEPRPFFLVRFCWKFPSQPPETEIHDFSGLNHAQALRKAIFLAVNKAESLRSFPIIH